MNVKKNIIFSLILAVLIISGFFFTKTKLAAPTRTEVAATIFPLCDIAQNIAGSSLAVACIVPPGASPHTFDPASGLLRKLSDAQVIYAVGHGLDDWSVDFSKILGAEVVTADKNIVLRQSVETGGDDPHYWLDVRNAVIIAKNISEDLSVRFPEKKEIFTENFLTYEKRLKSLHDDIINILRDAEDKNIVTFHDAWYYFAAAYGLNVIGTYEPTAGREPTPQYLVALVEMLRQAKVKTFYTEPQFSSEKIKSFLQDNNLQMAVIDPEGSLSGLDSYIAMMQYNAKTIAQNN